MDEKKKFYWLRVTHDEFELPTAVAESAGELARICGVTKSTVMVSVHRREKYGYRSGYARVVREKEYHLR